MGINVYSYHTSSHDNRNKINKIILFLCGCIRLQQNFKTGYRYVSYQNINEGLPGKKP